MEILTLEWRCFLAAARCGSVSQAADQLHLPQPSVSKYLQRLEHHLGVSLFRRSNRGLQLSEAGLPLYAKLSGLQEELQSDVLTALNSLEEVSGTVRLGTHHILALSYVTDPLAALYRAHPKLRVDLQLNTSLEICRLVATGKLDYGLVANPLTLPGLVIRKLCEEEVAVFSTLALPLNELGRIFYNPEMQLLPRILRSLRKNSLEAVPDYDFIAQLCKKLPRAGALIPAPVARRFGIQQRVSPVYYRASIALVYPAGANPRRGHHSSARHQALLKAFRS